MEHSPSCFYFFTLFLENPFSRTFRDNTGVLWHEKYFYCLLLGALHLLLFVLLLFLGLSTHQRIYFLLFWYTFFLLHEQLRTRLSSELITLHFCDYLLILTLFLILWCIRWLSSLFVTLHRKGFFFAWIWRKFPNLIWGKNCR